MNEFEQLALDTAAKSPCEKRKVGAVLVPEDATITSDWICSGANYNPIASMSCELQDGSTSLDVVHAEVAALHKLDEKLKEATVEGSWYGEKFWVMYVTHQPCENCLDSIAGLEMAYGIDIKVTVVEQFMKFDSGKLNYDLIPTSWIELDAEVLTKGAQKYKPNNWKEINPEEIMRYYSAAMRHLQEWKKFMDNHPDGHLFDDGEMGIGTHHLANARTNLGFLLTLTETKEKADEIRTNR